MNIKVTADSTCDLSADILEEYNIAITPLTVIKAGTGYIDGVTITPAEIFAHVAAGGDLCSTSAVSVGEYQEHFTKYAGEYDGVVHICISSDFSSTYRHACIAAEDFDNVRVVDSRNLSTGQGLVVLKACELAKTAASLDELKRELDDFTSRVEASFLVDRLDYLVRGGRCSSAAALGGEPAEPEALHRGEGRQDGRWRKSIAENTPSVWQTTSKTVLTAGTIWTTAFSSSPTPAVSDGVP